MKVNNQLPPASEWAYLEGEVTPSEAAAIDAQLADSGASRRSLDRARAILEALRAPRQELEGADLVPDLRHAIDEGAAPPPWQRARWASRIGGGLIAVAAAAMALLVLRGPLTRMLRPPTSQEAELRPKSAGAPAADRWLGIHAYRVRGSARPAPLDSSLRPDDGLLFAYTNLGPTPFAHLIIFAVDSQGRVYWFHPAHQQAGADPTSIPIRAGASAVELPELIHHPLAPGPLAIYGVFTRAPLRVSTIEEEVRALGPGAFAGQVQPRLAPADSGQQVLLTRVAP